MELLQQLNRRYATKQFDPQKKLTEQQLSDLLEAIRLSASSYGLQAYKIFVVSNPEVRAKLREASWGQPQITDASQLLVFAVDANYNEEKVDRFIQLTAETKGVEVSQLAAYAGMIKGIFNRTKEEVQAWLTRQVYIALGFGLVSSAVQGIDSCPMEGFDTAKYDEILGLTDTDYRSVVVMTVGFRSENDPYAKAPKVRFPKDELFEMI